jgi:hypothetical protein
MLTSQSLPYCSIVCIRRCCGPSSLLSPVIIFCWCCCGPLSLSLRISRSGVVVGRCPSHRLFLVPVLLWAIVPLTAHRSSRCCCGPLSLSPLISPLGVVVGHRPSHHTCCPCYSSICLELSHRIYLAMSSPSTPANPNMFSLIAKPGSRNPFLTPAGQLRTEQDSPPHLAHRRSVAPFSQIQLMSPNLLSVSDDDPLPDPLPPLQLQLDTFNDIYSTGRPTLVRAQANPHYTSPSTPSNYNHVPPPPPPYNNACGRNRSPRTRAPSDQEVIKEKTMAGVPNWPTNLRLSLIANNWLEWSRELINHLKMAQLHVYPLGLLSCPDQHTDRASYCNWQGNDQMVLGYISQHIFPAESQHIDNCVTSAEAYRLLRR